MWDITGSMRQVTRTLTAADQGVLAGHRVLICDRDTYTADCGDNRREITSTAKIDAAFGKW